MVEKERLGQMIQRHWQAPCSRMTEDLRKIGPLDETLQQAPRQTADLLYRLVSVQKTHYPEALEIAPRKSAFPPPFQQEE
jgi:hypothetical protein